MLFFTVEIVWGTGITYHGNSLHGESPPAGRATGKHPAGVSLLYGSDFTPFFEMNIMKKGVWMLLKFSNKIA